MLEKKYNPNDVEPRIHQKWMDENAFRAGANASRKETFTIMIPPPNVTGALHVGHAFNNTLQDVLIRWHRMRGFDTLWQPGQDHAGIATQLQVEKMLKQNQLPSRRDMGREKFLEKVWEWKGKYGDTIVNQLKRLGASCDWSRNAFTMAGAPGDPGTGHENSPNFHDAVIKVFVDMYNKGLIYRGKRLVNWDPHFETAISDLEVENIEVDGHMWHFKYPLAGGETYTYVERDEDGNIVLEEERDYISIATTRPETMLGDGAVAVHPSDERYAPIVGKLCEIPVGPKEHRRLIPIITDEYPDPDFGSGAVKITGAHDFNDYQVARRNNIPLYVLMDTKGHMRTDGWSYVESAQMAKAIAQKKREAPEDVSAINLVPEHLRGLDRLEARKKVVAEITAEGLAVMVEQTRTDKETGEETRVRVPYVENKKIMQPFGDRSGVVIEPMLTDQWYVDTAKIVEPALAAVREGRVEIMPESGEKVFFHWLNNIEPWCISRQLWWGHQIPVWYDDEGKEYCASSLQEAQAMAPGKTLTRDPDVLDTWFSSGLWPIGTLGWPNWTEETRKYFPTDVLITGQDILFFWVARMMMMQQAVVGEDPFHTVYLHELVRDEKGRKMSKVTGNVIDPLEIIDEFGADALRFTMAQMASVGGFLKLSTNRIKSYRNFVTKIWNAARFLEMNDCYRVEGFDPKTVSMPLNKWILGALPRVVAEIDRGLESLHFNDSANAAYEFVWGTFCDWYIELAKPTLQGEDGPQKDETRATAAYVLDQILLLLHPFMPFVTEELWAETGKTGPERTAMLVVSDWPDLAGLESPEAEDELNWLVDLISGIRSVRAEMNVPAGARIPLVVVGASPETQTRISTHTDAIRRLARITDLETAPDVPEKAAQLVLGEAVYALPLGDVIDVDAEKARLNKEIGAVEKEVTQIERKLSNQQFLAKAPERVVTEQKTRHADLSERHEKLKKALACLG